MPKKSLYLLFHYNLAQYISYQFYLGWPGMVEQGCKVYLEPLALDTGIPPEQFKPLLVANHYILLCQACTQHPAVVDMNTLATYLQPEIKSILDSVYPFLVAHESYFPKDSNLIVICFLVMATALANNLSPTFQSSHWDAWKFFLAKFMCLIYWVFHLSKTASR
ncbi:hypothetical protein EDD85DRAFT_787507 [Armillaria nabsnona]|nr:hypothetical protein EDD85DRAFT_787507 [Armillaria nabsnona]